MSAIQATPLSRPFRIAIRDQVMASQPSQTGHQSGLLTIALEVLLQITSYLTTPEYGNMRLVCRHLDAFLLKSFAHEFFTKKAFMLTEFSLQALVDISTSCFAPSLKYLIINVERPSPPSSHNHHNNAADITPDIVRDITREYYCSHKGLVSSGQDVELITEALRNLPNLETFGLRDFPSSGRYRDGGDEFWHPYGASTFQQQTGLQLSRPRYPAFSGHRYSEDEEYISHLFLTSLRALKNAKMTNCPTRFEVILRHNNLPDLAFSIPRCVEPDILPVLQDLKVLFLDLGRSTFPPRVVKKGATTEDFPGLLLAVFLSKLQSLIHLRLNFRDCSHNATTPFFKWLAQSSLDTSQDSTPPTSSQGASVGNELQSRVPQLPQAPSLPLLEELNIGMVTVSPVSLLNILGRYRSSLRRICLHKVILQHSASASQAANGGNLWASFLRQTARPGTKLTAIELSELKQHHNHDAIRVEFRDPSNMKLRTGVYRKRWVGSDCMYTF